ncbi:MAG: response regulator, partial [Paracoccaceae bacterium]|nr:response regulator [Paracoccaceae bacterium]
MDGTVLVADDDRTIRTVLTQALTRAGCKVHATSSLTTLMRWVAEGKGDVVISDVMMPDGNGLEMLPKIAQDRPGLPVIVISAQNTIMTAIQAAEAEAYDYLPKPFDLPDLMKRSARALEQKRHMPKTPPQVVREGSKRVVLTNFGEICKTLNRSTDHVYSFMLAEMGTTGSI